VIQTATALLRVQQRKANCSVSTRRPGSGSKGIREVPVPIGATIVSTDEPEPASPLGNDAPGRRITTPLKDARGWRRDATDGYGRGGRSAPSAE